MVQDLFTATEIRYYHSISDYDFDFNSFLAKMPSLECYKVPSDLDYFFSPVDSSKKQLLNKVDAWNCT